MVGFCNFAKFLPEKVISNLKLDKKDLYSVLMRNSSIALRLTIVS